jgi:hypothetical protein
MKPTDIIELEGHCWIRINKIKQKHDINGIMRIKRKDLEEQLQKNGYEFLKKV